MSENVSENTTAEDLKVLSEFIDHVIYPMSQIEKNAHYFNMESDLMRQFIRERDENSLKLPSIDVIRQRENQRKDICRYLYDGELDYMYEPYDPDIPVSESVVNDIAFVKRKRATSNHFVGFREVFRMLEIMSDLFSFEKVQEAISPDEEDPEKKEEAYRVAVCSLFYSYPVQFRLHSGYLTAKYIKHYQSFMEDYMNVDTPQKELVIPGEYHLPYLVPRRLRTDIDPNLISDKQEKKLRDMGFYQDRRSLCRRDCTGDDIRDLKVVLGRRALFGYTYENDFGKKSLIDLLEEKPVVVEKTVAEENSVKTTSAEEKDVDVSKKEEKPKKIPSKIVSGIFTVLAGIFELFAVGTSVIGLILAIIKAISWWGLIIYVIIVLAICVKLSNKGDEYNEYQRELRLREQERLYGEEVQKEQKRKRNTAKNKQRGGYGEEDF